MAMVNAWCGAGSRDQTGWQFSSAS